MGTTPNYGWVYPDNGGDPDTWGIILTTMFGDQDTDLKAVADALDALTALTATYAPVATVRDFLRKTPPTGWTILNGTIGDASSGADYANALSSNLFAFLWDEFTDAEIPLLTSAGAASTRGGDAASDFAAHKRMVLPTQAGKFRRSYLSGTSGEIGAIQAQSIQSHSHSIPLRQTSGGGNNVAASTGGSSFTGSTSSTGDTETRPANIAYLTCIKL